MAFSDARKCTAKAKSTGKPCKGVAMIGKTKCHKHGGATPSGAASANYKGKGYSKHLPTRLIDDYELSLADPELLANRKAVALLETRLIELIQSIDSNPIGNVWGEMYKAVMAHSDAMASGDAIATITTQQDMERIAKAGFKDHKVWQEIRDILQEKAKLVSAENKRINDQQLTVTVDRVMLLVSAIAGVVMEHVTDLKARDKITRGIDVLISSGV
jgi:hypothetical protein